MERATGDAIKTCVVRARVNKAEMEQFNRYCEKNKVNQSQAVRQAIQLLVNAKE